MNSKTVSLKDKKIISEKLRNENKKMEIRLQQLKLTMSKEKEDRLLSGNAPMWSTGAPGSVMNHKPNLPTIDKNKKIKLKILKEEEELMPREDKGSATRHTIKPSLNGDVLANRVDNFGRDALHSREDQLGGKKKCGQCEEAFAAVNCKECTEVYCAKCFAAFHLKGALRKHRSTPISNMSNRVSIPSPLFKPPDFNNFLNNSSRDNKESNKSQRTKNETQLDSDRSARDFKENESPDHTGLSLADGNYDEAMSKQYFQDALNAWRNGEEAPYKPVPARPRPMTEHSTSTSAESTQQVISDKIQFTPSLSYAEKLLLRKHRTCQLGPVEMKYILNRMSKNNETELLENQRLMNSNLILETSAINESMTIGPLTDDCHMEIGSLTDLWSEAKDLDGQILQSDVHISPTVNVGVNYIISTTNDDREEAIKSKPSLQDSVGQKQHNSPIGTLTIAPENNEILKEASVTSKPPAEISKLKLSSRRSHSSIGRNSFNDRPQSARRMSARTDRGGKIATKPSVLLNMLASFNEYLPTDENPKLSSATSTVRFNSAGSSRQTTKLNYNFYKIAPQSWKPAQAWTERTQGTKQENSLKTSGEMETDAVMEGEYDEELEKLNFFAPNSSVHEFIEPVSLDRVSSSNSDASDENQLDNSDVDYIDHEAEEAQSMEQLETFERELTLVSRKDTEINNGGDYDEIIADSLDLQNYDDSLDVTESDKFHFEDSLDFQQRYSKNSEHGNEDSDEDLRNCSSRFNDYDDVHNLR